MESITKYRLSPDTLKRLAREALGERDTEGIRFQELTEGAFNAAYLAETKTRDYILKVGPRKGTRIMSYEKNIMDCEVKVMELLRQYPEIPAARVVFYQPWDEECCAPYFFMERLSGKSLWSEREHLSGEQVHEYKKKLGRLNRKLHAIEGQMFGYVGQPQMQERHWYPAFRRMLLLGISDARALGIDLKIDTDRLLFRLEEEKECFEEVTVPCLVHWDLWDGNVFVSKGDITGIIDWERAVWADPLLELGFRTYEDPADFLEGYGKRAFSPAEKRRIKWYNIYLMVLTALECDYRGYEDRTSYEYATGRLQEEWENWDVPAGYPI